MVSQSFIRQGYPTTYFINDKFNLYGYIEGYLNGEQLNQVILDTINDK